MAALRTRRRNAHWLLLIAAALLMRAAIPQGMMTQASEAGGIEVTLCNSDATWTIPFKSTDAPPGDGHEPGQQCLFAGHALGDAPPPPLAAPTLPQLSRAAYDAVRERALSPDTPADLPPATGPPVHV